MDRQLTWKQANWHVLQGKAARREAWRRWVIFDAFDHLHKEQLPASDAAPVTVRVARSISATGSTPDDSNFTIGKEDLDANDWTLLPWDSASPAPTVPPAYAPVTGAGGGGSGGGAGGSGDAPGDGDTPLKLVIYGAITPGSGGGGRTVPHDPPPHAPAVVTCTAVILSENPQNEFRVAVTITIAGGPADLGGLSVVYAGHTKLLGNGYDGYSQTTILEGADAPILAPGGTIDFVAHYAADLRDGWAALTEWTGTGSVTCTKRTDYDVHEDGAVLESGFIGDASSGFLAAPYSAADHLGAILRLAPINIDAADIASAVVTINGTPVDRAAYGSDLNWDTGNWLFGLFAGFGSDLMIIGSNTITIAADSGFAATLTFDLAS